MNETFSKWQERTQNLRTHTISVFLGITLATIGFIIDKVSEESFTFTNTYSKVAFITAAVILLANALSTLILMLNRLEGFRHTTSIVRKRNKNEQIDIEELRQESLKIDLNTHWLFRLSVWLFSLGELITIIAFAIQISFKLK